MRASRLCHFSPLLLALLASAAALLTEVDEVDNRGPGRMLEIPTLK